MFHLPFTWYDPGAVSTFSLEKSLFNCSPLLSSMIYKVEQKLKRVEEKIRKGRSWNHLIWCHFDHAHTKTTKESQINRFAIINEWQWRQKQTLNWMHLIIPLFTMSIVFGYLDLFYTIVNTFSYLLVLFGWLLSLCRWCVRFIVVFYCCRCFCFDHIWLLLKFTIYDIPLAFVWFQMHKKVIFLQCAASKV